MNPVFAHIIGAVVMTLVFGLSINPLTGWLVSTTFYYSRELSQHQTILARTTGVFRSTLWLKGWWPLSWDAKQQAEFIVPVSCAFVVMLLLIGVADA